jgi:hypothetical protein
VARTLQCAVSSHAGGGLRRDAQLDETIQPSLEDTIMHRTLKSSLFIAAVVALGTIAVTASAHNAISGSGHAVPLSNSSCFSESYGSITNSCAGAQLFEIPLDASTNPWGYLNATISAYGATSSNNVGCASFGVNSDITAVWGGSFTYLTSFGAFQTITLPGTYVPGGGSAYIACTINQGGRINVVNF